MPVIMLLRKDGRLSKIFNVTEKLHIDFFDSLLIFVVQSNLKYNAITSIQAGTTLQGRQTGASPTVMSMHCIEVLCGDLPLLFHSTQCFMQSTIDENAMLKRVLHDFFDQNPADEVKATLWQMFISTLGSPETEGASRVMLVDLAFTYKSLCGLIDNMHLIHRKTIN